LRKNRHVRGLLYISIALCLTFAALVQVSIAVDPSVTLGTGAGIGPVEDARRADGPGATRVRRAGVGQVAVQAGTSRGTDTVEAGDPVRAQAAVQARPTRAIVRICLAEGTLEPVHAEASKPIDTK